MAILGRIDEMLRPKGISMTIAPLGAVCAVLFATPTSPGARVRLVSASSLSTQMSLHIIFTYITTYYSHKFYFIL